MVKLSVIIALYNNRIFIKDCIDSIYLQSLSDDEFEVIVVDDGSTDGGGDWVEQNYSSHSNLHVIRHAENKGLGEARNTGLKNAKGEYLHFVDADDFILTGSYRYLIDHILPLESDVIYTSFVRDGHVGDCFENVPVSFTGSKSDYLQSNSIAVHIWQKIFRRTFINSNHLHWLPINYNEDAYFTWNALRYECSIIVWQAKIYSYRTNKDSLVNCRNVEQVKKSVNDIIIVNQQLKSFSSCYDGCPAVKSNFTHKYQILFNRILCTPYSYKEIKEIFPQCAKIGISHLRVSGYMKAVNFLYHHPFIYFIFQSLIVRLYFQTHKVTPENPDFIDRRL